MKICSKCGKEFPATNEYFYWTNKANHTLNTQCKRCITERKRQYNLDNKEAIAEHRKQYRVDNEEAIKQYNLANKERMQQWRDKNKEVANEYAKRYQQEHLEEWRIRKHKRNARIRNLPRTLTVSQWEETKEYFDNRCCYCNRELPLEQDHFIPLGKDGWYAKTNIVPACKNCNSRKRTQEAIGWFSKQTFYSKVREAKILKYLGVSAPTKTFMRGDKNVLHRTMPVRRSQR